MIFRPLSGRRRRQSLGGFGAGNGAFTSGVALAPTANNAPALDAGMLALLAALLAAAGVIPLDVCE